MNADKHYKTEDSKNDPHKLHARTHTQGVPEQMKSIIMLLPSYDAMNAAYFYFVSLFHGLLHYADTYDHVVS